MSCNMYRSPIDQTRFCVYISQRENTLKINKSQRDIEKASNKLVVSSNQNLSNFCFMLASEMENQVVPATIVIGISTVIITLVSRKSTGKIESKEKNTVLLRALAYLCFTDSSAMLLSTDVSSTDRKFGRAKREIIFSNIFDG